MCHALNRVNDRAAEVISRVSFVLGACPVVRGRVAAVDDRITHSLVGVVDRHFSPNTPPCAFVSSFVHLFEPSQVLFNRSIPPLARFSIHSLRSHSLLLGVICVGVSVLDDLDGILMQLVKVVTAVTSLIGCDTHEGEILEDGILELLFLVRGVGVVKADQKSPLVFFMGKIIVQKGSLGVSNVEVSRRLRRESSDHALVGVEERNVVAGTFLGLGSLLLFRRGIQGFQSSDSPWAQLLQKGEPASQVDQISLANSTNGYTVSAESTPQGNVGGRETVSDNERAKDEVIVELLKLRVDCFEVERCESVELGEPFVFLKMLVRHSPRGHG